jgi:hypothetical protein
MAKGIILYADGEIEEINYDGNYEKLCSIVDGYIQLVSFGDKDYFCYCNEEGKLIGCPENHIATSLWYNSGQRILIGDYIAGNVVFFGGVDDDANDTDVPDSLMEEIKKMKEMVF